MSNEPKRNKGFSFKEHGLMLYLDKQEYLAFIKLQADKGLGRSYAGKLAFCEGIFHLGYFNQEEYDKHIEKYSEGLIHEEPKPLTKHEISEKEKLENVEKILTSAWKEWHNLTEKAKAYHLKTAAQHAELPISKLILESVDNG